LEDRRNIGQSSCNFGDGTDQRVQSLMFMMMMMMMNLGVFNDALPTSQVPHRRMICLLQIMNLKGRANNGYSPLREGREPE